MVEVFAPSDMMSAGVAGRIIVTGFPEGFVPIA